MALIFPIPIPKPQWCFRFTCSHFPVSTSTSKAPLGKEDLGKGREGRGKGKGLAHTSCTHCQGHIIQFRLTALGEVDAPTKDSNTLRSNPSLHTTTLFVGTRNMTHLNSPWGFIQLEGEIGSVTPWVLNGSFKPHCSSVGKYRFSTFLSCGTGWEDSGATRGITLAVLLPHLQLILQIPTTAAPNLNEITEAMCHYRETTYMCWNHTHASLSSLNVFCPWLERFWLWDHFPAGRCTRAIWRCLMRV